MRALELKIPPLALVLLVGALMVLASSVLPALALLLPARAAVAIAFVIAGAGIAAAGVRAFHRARTTVNPTRPDTASTLVTHGIYRYTRNPMYLGFVLALLGWAVWLSHAAAFAGPLVFVLLMSRLQIIPEERALARRFGNEFAAYRSRVRRWA